MDDKLKKGLQHCKPHADCSKCPYYQYSVFACYEALHIDALWKIRNQESTIIILMELNQKLAQELQNSLDLTEGGADR